MGQSRKEGTRDRDTGPRAFGSRRSSRARAGALVLVPIQGRFACSDIGRTRTAPDPKKPLDKLSFAFASCQHYEAGYFTAYQHMAQEDIELVVHLGDYIYEGAMRPGRPRQHTGQELASLSDYRNRYALYRTDPDLQRAHALFPWIVTWDDHEVDNNYAGDKAEDGDARDAFLERRANAYQAYYEHMPLRRESMPKGSSLRLYRQACVSEIWLSFRCWTRGSTERISLAMTATSRSVRPRLRQRRR